MTRDTAWIERARAWATNDCDESDRQATLALLAAVEAATPDADALLELERNFSSMLSFGTAGLRGSVGPGPGAMNRAMIRITTRAVAEHLLELHGPGALVVLGNDARLSSPSFARDTAGVLVAAGLRVRFFAEPVPTPVLAYAIKHQRAVAGIVITASHNPKQDNGYKLYGGDGVQIVSPTDQQIAARMQLLDNPAEIPCEMEAIDGENAGAELMPGQVVEDYFATILAQRPGAAPCRDLKIVYTPIHGVGGAFVRRALSAAGFQELMVVPEQAEPDGNFPTAPNPNPERPGTLDLALSLAQECDADVVLANDPDADRLAVCARIEGEFTKLTGNQIGVLLADALLCAPQPGALVVRSIVSSPMLDVIAAERGVHCEQTLTGFKWLWAAGLELQQQAGKHFVFGFEEALGYSIGDVVRDKDGVGAALRFAELVAALRSEGRSIADALASLYRRYGLWVSTQLPIKKATPEGLQEIQDAIVDLANSPPAAFGAHRVREMTDYRSGGEQRPRWLENTALLEFQLEGGGRVLVRPSGTEPLLKIYVDLRADLRGTEDVWQRQRELQLEASALAEQVRAACGV